MNERKDIDPEIIAKRHADRMADRVRRITYKRLVEALKNYRMIEGDALELDYTVHVKVKYIFNEDGSIEEEPCL